MNIGASACTKNGTKQRGSKGQRVDGEIKRGKVRGNLSLCLSSQDVQEWGIIMDKVIQRAYAKINIGLDVLRRRADGYHEVKMIMQTVDIYDELVLEKREQPGIELRTDNSELPLDGDNLICKAVSLLFREKKIEGGVRSTLTKRIPIAAGMAGGKRRPDRGAGSARNCPSRREDPDAAGGGAAALP